MCDILTTPHKIMGSIESGVALAAVSLTGNDLEINMRLPGIKKELDKLVDKGIGATLEYQGAKFMFVECKFLCFTAHQVPTNVRAVAYGHLGVTMGLEDLD